MTRDLAAELKALEVEPASEGLKPCPFCGGEAGLIAMDEGDEPKDALYGCAECEVWQQGPERWNTRAAGRETSADSSRCPSCGGDGVECCRRPPCGGCGCLAHDGGTCFTGPARDAIFAAEQEVARLRAQLAPQRLPPDL